MVELLVVMAIIVMLAGVLLGVTASLRSRSWRDRTTLLIQKVEAALAEYRTTFGQWPTAFGGIPDAASYSATTCRGANNAVCVWLRQYEEFESRTAEGRIPEIIEDPNNSGRYLVVDVYYVPDDAAHDADASDALYQFLNFAQNGFNRPELDIWSNGPDGADDRTANAEDYGDDVINWARR
jgi:type II secretory pathway pseudopilin PulG